MKDHFPLPPHLINADSVSSEYADKIIHDKTLKAWNVYNATHTDDSFETLQRFTKIKISAQNNYTARVEGRLNIQAGGQNNNKLAAKLGVSPEERQKIREDIVRGLAIEPKDLARGSATDPESSILTQTWENHVARSQDSSQASRNFKA